VLTSSGDLLSPSLTEDEQQNGCTVLTIAACSPCRTLGAVNKMNDYRLVMQQQQVIASDREL
jgi:hypothetical protein